VLCCAVLCCAALCRALLCSAVILLCSGHQQELDMIPMMMQKDFKPKGEQTVFLSHLYLKVMTLPRQARDKHRENSKKARFVAGCSGSDFTDRW
jgi:hypothetical protein